MTAFMNKLDALLGGVVALICAVALGLATLGIISRYGLRDFNLDWILEVNVFLVIWAILLCVPRLERRISHVRVDFLYEHMPRFLQLISIVLSIAVGIGISLLLIYAGWQVVVEARMWDERTPSTLRVPLWIYYTALPAAFGLNLLVLCERLVRFFRGEDQATAAGLTE